MGAQHANRIWILGGGALVAAIVLIGWLFVINPKYAEISDVHDQTATAEIQILSLKKRTAELEKEAKQLPAFKKTLARNQAALPADSGVPDFLRQLQSSADDLDVKVGGITVSAPTLVAGSATVYSLPMTLTADGGVDAVSKFIEQLQGTQPRAVLIESANVTAQADGSAADGADAGSDVTINLTLNVYVAVPAGAGAPTITTQ